MKPKMKPFETLKTIAVWLCFSHQVLAQSIPVEVFSGHWAYRYQHNFSGQINNRLGISHSSTLLESYTEKETEIMTQSYLTLSLGKNVKLGLGTFYASVPGFSPSLNLQFMQKKSNWMWIIVPRIDLKEKPSYDVMAMLECRPQLSQTLRLYTRIQLMENFTGSIHNRGYNHIRVGIDLKKIQLGLASGLESYGKKYEVRDNYGLFFRSEL
ncbi:hypothetical protein [Flavobacterium sp.]|uniref:hypothetical protein n=1 Tax=Flavobacterium sp. TaxID=239 RepID=UPI002FDE6DC2